MNSRGRTRCKVSSLIPGDLLIESNGQGKMPSGFRVVSVEQTRPFVKVLFEGYATPAKMYFNDSVEVSSADGR